MSKNPFEKVGTSPKIGTRTFPGAIEDAAMIKKAMMDPGDEVVKEESRRSTEYSFLPKIKYTVEGL